jgi:carboxypeptidase family protein
MAPSTSTDSRRFPVWGWVVLIGAVFAVLAVVLGPGEEPQSVDPIPGPGEIESSETREGPQLADPGAPPEQPWASDLLTVELRNLGGIEEERISPKRAGSMEGAVLDEAKQGIEGARLTIVGGPQGGWSTVSRKQGHYLFPELLPGTHFFRIDVPGYGSTVRSHRVRGVGRSWRDFRVAPAIGVELMLRDFENKPLAGARVYTGLSDQEILSGEDGIARVPPIVGGERVLLTIRAEGHVPVRQELNLMIRPANAPPIEVPALPKGARVLGKVLSWPGSPYPQVSVVPRSNKISTHKIAWETWQGVQIEPDGSFVLQDVPTSHLIDIRVFHPSGVTEPRLRSVQPARHTPTRVEFVIKRGDGRVAGRVFDEKGAALPRAKLVLEAVDPSAMLGKLYPGLELTPSTAMLPVPAPLRRELRSRNDGGFDFAVGDHPEGTGSLVLTVSAPGYQSRRLPIRRSFTNLAVNLALEDHSSSLQLLASNRPALPKIEWYLDGRLVEEVDGVAVEQGTAKLNGLASGLYDVLVRSGGEVVRHDRELRIDGNTGFDL